VVAVAVVAVGAVALFAFVTAATPSTPAVSTVYVSKDAAAIVSSAAQAQPAGFVFQASQTSPSEGSDWATLQQADGSDANVTVMVYPTAAASQGYYGRYVRGVEGLPGYANVTSDLASFQQYGRCYGYGEDVDGIAVINGVCTKGNTFLQVHLVSAIDFQDLEGDLTSIMGALYESAA